MEQFNKALSFILGLVVVVIFIAVASGKINLKGKLPALSKNQTTNITPTLTPAPRSLALTQTQKTREQSTAKTTNIAPTASSNYHSYSETKGAVNTIPNTGPGLFIPFAVTSLLGGVFLKRSGKKE